MAEQIIYAIAYFLLNPLFLLTLIAAVALGYIRVKRERRHFKVRLLPGLTEFRKLLTESWLYALLLSVIISGVGLIVDLGWVILLSIMAFIVLLSFFYTVASPIYYAAGAFFTLYFLQLYAGDFTYRGWSIKQLDLLGDLAITIPIIAGLLLIVEGLLIRRHTAHYTSPYFVQTNRGLRAAVFKSKRLWLLPIVFLVPGEWISAYVPYWPQFTLGNVAFSFIPVPIVIGFSHIGRSIHPELSLPKIGLSVIWTGIIVGIVGVLAFWIPILGWAALQIGLICRIGISVHSTIREYSKGFMAAPMPSGVVIAGVLPHSPAEKMGLKSGECIKSVNGIRVNNEKELYDAIQINAAHCRLQVIDRGGEVRLTQQVIYRHDHHRLGLLVVR